tara:strand:+ start:1526 stop:2734 length:1209 start_codon:yes stop_codon:yes gene_type:complete
MNYNYNYSPKKRIYICINNNVYDVSDFSNIHPGGNIINYYNCIGNNIDATHAFNTFHLRSKVAYKLLNTLTIIERKNCQKNDFNKLIQKWKKKGYYDTKYSFFILWSLITIVCCYLSYMLLYYDYPFLGGHLIGIVWTHCGFIQHHAGHLGFTGNSNIDLTIQTFFEGFLKGGSARWWRNRHNKHHAMPNSIKYDGDLRTTPFFAWDPILIRKVPTCLLKRQHILFIPFMILYVPVFFVTTKLFIIRKKYWYELCIILLHFYCSSYFVKNINNYIIFYWIGYSIQGLYLGLMFALSHFAMPRIDNLETSWEKWQIATTCNWGVGNRYAELLSGFLNLQIEHHIVPQMPAENVNLIIKDVIEYCNANNITYTNYTFKEAFIKMIDGLKIAGYDEYYRREKKLK